MKIERYLKALRGKANPRWLKLIVPLYTGTEPDIVVDPKDKKKKS